MSKHRLIDQSVSEEYLSISERYTLGQVRSTAGDTKAPTIVHLSTVNGIVSRLGGFKKEGWL